MTEEKGGRTMFDSGIELGVVLFLFIYALVVSFMLISKKRKN